MSREINNKTTQRAESGKEILPVAPKGGLNQVHFPVFQSPGAPLPLAGNHPVDFEPSPDIICGLPHPAVEFIFSNSGKSGPLPIIVQVTESKVLLNNVSNLGKFLVSAFFEFRKLCRRSIFSHNAVFNIVKTQNY